MEKKVIKSNKKIIVLYSLLLLLLGARIHTYSIDELDLVTILPYFIILVLLIFFVSPKIISFYYMSIIELWKYFLKEELKEDVKRVIDLSLFLPLSIFSLFVITTFSILFYFVNLASKGVMWASDISYNVTRYVGEVYTMSIGGSFYEIYAKYIYLLIFFLLLLIQTIIFFKYYNKNLLKTFAIFLSVNILFCIITYGLSYLIYYAFVILVIIIGIFAIILGLS